MSLLALLISLPLSLAAPSDGGSEGGEWVRRHLPERGQWELGGFAGLMIISPRHDYYALETAPQRDLARLGPEAGLRAAYFPLSLLGVEAEFSGIWTRVTEADDAPAFLYGLRGHAILQLPLYRVVPFALGGYGITGVRSSRDAVGSDVDPAGHYGLGVKLMADDRFAVRLDARHLLPPANVSQRAVSSHFSINLGITIRLGPQPNLRRGKRRAEDEPESRPADTDGDGVLDGGDVCPGSAGPPPTGCPEVDSDGDGVLDRFDRCPGREGEDTDGCPLADTDGDGKTDRADRCPWEAADTADGCTAPPQPPPPPVVAPPPPEPEPPAPDEPTPDAG